MRPTTVAAQDDLLGRITEAISLLSAQIISHENSGIRVGWRAPWHGMWKVPLDERRYKMQRKASVSQEALMHYPNHHRFLSRVILAAAVIALAAGFAASPVLFSAAQKLPQPIPSPNAPDPSFPPGINGPGIKDPDAKVLDRENQAQVKAEIEKLYALVFELRETMKQTDANSTLSVTVVKKAQAIEKLAKDIKDRAKN
jgi:hypothetical protein